MKVTEIALAVNREAHQKEIGIRPGEKLHEEMISSADAYYTYEYPYYYKILPSINHWYRDSERIGDGIKVNQDFIYRSDSNKDWMKVEDLEKWIKKNYNKIGKI